MLAPYGSGKYVPKKRLGRVTIHVYIGLVKQTHGGKNGGWCPVRANRDSPYRSSGVCWIKTYVYMNTHHTHFHPEDGGSICLRNVGNVAHLCKAKIPNDTININDELP